MQFVPSSCIHSLSPARWQPHLSKAIFFMSPKLNDIKPKQIPIRFFVVVRCLLHRKNLLLIPPPRCTYLGAQNHLLPLCMQGPIKGVFGGLAYNIVLLLMLWAQYIHQILLKSCHILPIHSAPHHIRTPLTQPFLLLACFLLCILFLTPTNRANMHEPFLVHYQIERMNSKEGLSEPQKDCHGVKEDWSLLFPEIIGLLRDRWVGAVAILEPYPIMVQQHCKGGIRSRCLSYLPVLFPCQSDKSYLEEKVTKALLQVKLRKDIDIDDLPHVSKGVITISFHLCSLKTFRAAGMSHLTLYSDTTFGDPR